MQTNIKLVSEIFVLIDFGNLRYIEGKKGKKRVCRIYVYRIHLTSYFIEEVYLGNPIKPFSFLTSLFKYNVQM